MNIDTNKSLPFIIPWPTNQGLLSVMVIVTADSLILTKFGKFRYRIHYCLFGNNLKEIQIWYLQYTEPNILNPILEDQVYLLSLYRLQRQQHSSQQQAIGLGV